jgi:hypothetical protein
VEVRVQGEGGFWDPFNPKDIGRHMLAAGVPSADRRSSATALGCRGARSADSDDAAMSFRDHAAIYSGLIPPPCVGLFDGLVLG